MSGCGWLEVVQTGPKGGLRRTPEDCYMPDVCLILDVLAFSSSIYLKITFQDIFFSFFSFFSYYIFEIIFHAFFSYFSSSYS